MKKFWELLEKSVLIQSAITLVIVATYCYLIIEQRVIATQFEVIVFAVLGFWFGSISERHIANKQQPKGG